MGIPAFQADPCAALRCGRDIGDGQHQSFFAAQVRMVRCVFLNKLRVLLQGQSQFRYNGGMGCSHIAEMPGLMSNAGDRLLSRWIAFDKSKVCGSLAEGPADAPAGKIGTDVIQQGFSEAQIDGQPCLVLTASGKSYKPAGKCFSPVPERFFPDLPLLPGGTPAADRRNMAPAADFFHELLQQGRGAAFHKLLGAFPDRNERRDGRFAEGMAFIYQDQTAPVKRFFFKCQLFHVCFTSDSMIRVRSSRKERPAVFIMAG